MPILKLKPACKDYLWGGPWLKREFHITSPLDPLAEAWVLSCHPDGPAVIENGPWAGRTLAEYVREHPCLGTRCVADGPFPLLIKLIDASRDLSIQVHPSDEYALSHEGQYGKTEVWYILHAQPGATLYYGFKEPCSRETLEAALQNGTLTDLLQSVPVRKGDVFYVPPGTVHAVGKGIFLAEIQQSSNVTYRLYDYGRLGADGRPRPLHIPQALDVADRRPASREYDFGGHMARCGYFTADIYTAPYSGVCGPESFLSLVAVDGTGGTLACGGETVPVQKGDSFFLPAGSGAFTVEGDCTILQTSAGPGASA